MNQMPFWSDDFDMDLLKVIPGVEELLGESASLSLYTHGHTTFGRLNHPSVWNDYRGPVAFFGLHRNATTGLLGVKPPGYWTDEPIVECTFLEALRDCWPHTYRLVVEGAEVFDSFRLCPAFEVLMFHIRGWKTVQEQSVERIQERVRRELTLARDRLVGLIAEKGLVS